MEKEFVVLAVNPITKNTGRKSYATRGDAESGERQAHRDGWRLIEIVITTEAFEAWRWKARTFLGG